MMAEAMRDATIAGRKDISCRREPKKTYRSASSPSLACSIVPSAACECSGSVGIVRRSIGQRTVSGPSFPHGSFADDAKTLDPLILLRLRLGRLLG